MNAYEQLVEDSDRLRALIQRWRSTPENTAALLPEASRALLTSAAAKEEVLYPAIRRHDPDRTELVAAAVRTNMQVEAFLAAAIKVGPDGRGFLDQAHEAAAAADELLLHERRDLFPALRSDAVDDNELARIVDRTRTARARYSDKLAAVPRATSDTGAFEGDH